MGEKNLSRKIQKLTGFLARKSGFLTGKTLISVKKQEVNRFRSKTNGILCMKNRKLAAVVASKKQFGWVPDRPGPKKRKEHTRAEKKRGWVGSCLSRGQNQKKYNKNWALITISHLLTLFTF